MIDPRLDAPGRDGLTGTTPADRCGLTPEPGPAATAPDFRPDADQPAWRRDFPVDWAQDQDVERRDFMKFLVLTSAAMAAGQLWIGVQNWLRRRRGQPALKRVASIDDLAIGSAIVFDYPAEHDSCVLVRLGERELVAFSQKCTHLSCAVIPRPSENVIFCPCHDGVFDLRSGRPLSGPPPRPLPRILIEVRGRDVYATGVEVRSA